jgi:hypothetical protein
MPETEQDKGVTYLSVDHGDLWIAAPTLTLRTNPSKHASCGACCGVIMFACGSSDYLDPRPGIRISEIRFCWPLAGDPPPADRPKIRTE